MEQLSTNLQGRLRNTNLPKSKALLPLFEAVANSFHAIEESHNSNNGTVKIVIKRSPMDNCLPEFDNNDQINSIQIIDNGIGFNDENYKSFLLLDSDKKVNIGGRGIGRLMWLKAFRSVQIKSNFETKEEIKTKEFLFTEEGVSDITGLADDDIFKRHGSCVELQNLRREYAQHIPKTLNSIANALVEHFLEYFLLQENAIQNFDICDEDESINIKELIEKEVHSKIKEIKNIKGKEFCLFHTKSPNSSKKHCLVLCTAGRKVKEIQLQDKISGLYGPINEDNNPLYYIGYLKSDFLDDNVSSDRTAFNIEQSNTDNLLPDSEISFEDIENEIIPLVKDYLKDAICENVNLGKKRVQSYIKAHPRYRILLSKIPEDQLIIDPKKSDKELEQFLHEKYYDCECLIINEGHEIKNLKEVPQERIDNYIKNITELKQQLVNYVCRRKLFLDVLEEKISIDEDGKFCKEEAIHKMIMPMGKTSNELFFDELNLWVIDERLAFHQFMTSDKPLKKNPQMKSKEKKRPDIYSICECDRPLLINEGSKFPLSSINIVEFKRPMRNDKDNPITQVFEYVEKIREGKAKILQTGRPIPNSTDMPAFCYIICDLTEQIQKNAKAASLQMTNDKMGYFGYNPNFNAYIEIISFNQLLNRAKERNRAFFDKLGLS